MDDDLAKVREFGEMAAQLVFRGLPKPKGAQVDSWLVYLSSGLFSAVFELMPLVGGSIESEELREEVTTAFFQSAANHASDLANEALRKGMSIFKRGRMTFDFRERIYSDIVGCFHCAVDAVEERAYDLPTARTHAVFVYIDAACKALIMSGAITLNEANAQAHSSFMKGAYDFAEHMAGQVNELLDRHRR